MLRCMIAPLPIVHVSSTLTTAAERGRVAFGSDAFAFFERREKDKDFGKLEVFVIASRTGLTDAKQVPLGIKLHCAFLRGTLAGLTQPHPKTGKHPDPSVRPASAHEGDGPSLIFWELVALETLAEQIPLKAFRNEGGGMYSEVPRGPTIAKIDL